MPQRLVHGGSAGPGTWCDDFFSLAAFKDLYLLASYGTGRHHVQVLNRLDECCFGQAHFDNSPAWDDTIRAYEAEVRSQSPLLAAGSFRVEIDETVPGGHEFGLNARVATLLSEVNGRDPTVAGIDNSSAVVRGMNGNLWHRTATGWTNTGFALTGTPAVVVGAVPGHQSDVIFRDPFGQVRHVFFNGTAWQQGSPMPGVISSDPSAISLTSGRIDVVAFGGDFKLYQWTFQGGSWTLQQVHGSAMGIGRVSLVSWASNRLDIFFRALAPSVWHLWSNGGPPYNLEQVGGTIKNYPVAVANPTNSSLRVYAIGLNDELWEAFKPNGGSWSWASVSAAASASGTRLLGTPTALRGADGVVSVYATIAGQNLGRFSLNGSWTFANIAAPAGVPLLDSPAFAVRQGSIYVLGRNHGVYRYNAGWTGLGGYVDR